MAKETIKKNKTDNSRKGGSKALNYSNYKLEWRMKFKKFFEGIFHIDFTKGERVKKTVFIPKGLYEIIDSSLKDINDVFTDTYYAKNEKRTKGHFSENDFFNLMFMDSLNAKYEGGDFAKTNKNGDLTGYLKENENDLKSEFDKFIDEGKEKQRARVRELQKRKRAEEKEAREKLERENEELKRRLAELEGKDTEEKDGE